MIAVSNEFKNAIKSSERRIKGYVEVLYDLPSVTITPVADYSSTYTNIAEIVDGKIIPKKVGKTDIKGVYNREDYIIHLTVTDKDLINPSTKNNLLLLTLLTTTLVGTTIIIRKYKLRRNK